jgi:hypothetical protein
MRGKAALNWEFITVSGEKDADDDPPLNSLDDYLGDYTLGISTHGLRKSVPWKLKDYGDNGALTDDQIDELATRFVLSRNQLRGLSWELGKAMCDISSSVVLISRSNSSNAAEDEIRAAIEELIVAEKKIRNASQRLSMLWVDDLTYSPSQQKFEWARTRLVELHDEMRNIKDSLEEARSKPQVAFLLKPENPKTIRDRVRDHVVSEITLFWHGIGRKLTFTTDTITSERRGALVDFVNAVVGCVSEPPGKLSGEAIIEGIKKAKITVSVFDDMKDLF